MALWDQTQTKEHHLSADATSNTVTFDSTATAGNLLVLACGSDTSTLTAPAGYSTAKAKATTIGGRNLNAAIFYKVAAGTETNAIVAHSTGVSGVVFYEVAMAGNTPVVDVTAEGVGASGTSQSTGTTGTTAAASEYACGCWALENTPSGSAMASFAMTNTFINGTLSHNNGGGGSTTGGVYAGNKVLSGTGTVESILSWTTTANAQGIIATFKISGAAPVVAVVPIFPYRMVLAAQSTRLTTPVLGAPLFTKMVGNAVNGPAGVATGTGTAYNATIQSQSNASIIPHQEILGKAKPNVLGLPTMGSPLFRQFAQPQAGVATGTGTAYNATVTATEYQRPISDISTGSWTVAPLWSKVDEVTADDSDFITSETLVAPGNTSSTDLRLSATGDPLSSANQTISVRAKVAFTLGLNGGIRSELRQGSDVTSTLIGTLATDALTTSFVTYTYTLSGAEADSITNYGDLFLRLYGNFPVGSLGGVTVSWVQFQLPAEITPDTVTYPTTATGTGTAYDATGKVAPNAGNANGTGTAYDATARWDVRFNIAATVLLISIPNRPVEPIFSGPFFRSTGVPQVTIASAGVATGVGTAYNATVSLAPSAGLAAGTGVAYDATVVTVTSSFYPHIMVV